MNAKIEWEMHVDRGWRDVVRATVAGVERFGGEISQVKEKFGALRIYHHGGDNANIHKLVGAAEYLSRFICENCGRPGELRSSRPWIRTFCDACDEADSV